MDGRRQLEYLRLLGVSVWVPADAALTPVGASASASVNTASARQSVGEELAGEDKGAAGLPPSPPSPPPSVSAAEKAASPATDTPPPAAAPAPVAPSPDTLVADTPPAAKSMDWQTLEATVRQCVLCDLHQGRTQTVFGVGDRAADLMVIGEGPGEEEDRQGEPFVGRAGKLLDEMLFAIGQPREKVYIANVVKCRPPKNRNPRPEEARCCAPYLQNQIDLVQPKVIMALGAVAAQHLLQTQAPIGKMRGRQYQHGDIPVVVTYHPAYLLRSPQEKRKSWQDLKAARGLLAA